MFLTTELSDQADNNFATVNNYVCKFLKSFKIKNYIQMKISLV